MGSIRRDAPEGDRGDPALVPAEPHWATARDGTRYVRVIIYPGTLDELRTFCRDYGEAAVADARWSCVKLWLMSGWAVLRNPQRDASPAILIAQEYDRIRLGWPRHDDEAWPPATFDRLTPDIQREALRVATETLADWEAAGRPYATPHKIKQTYQYLIGCPAFRTKYVGPADEPHKETE